MAVYPAPTACYPNNWNHWVLGTGY
ncbi:hypothetical protein SBA7_600007 [Candidatus Sulfotelmatobacter sp. SbA7]|nr:hypothetical protein SBA7_600007 [Candidatus Sulfotelmatobacter sp. SbA7]